MRNREPVLEQPDSGAHEHPFQIGYLPHKLEVFEGVTKAHYALDARPVVPGAIEEDHFSGRRQVFYVALKIPLPSLMIGRLFEGYDARGPRVQMFHEALDGTALAGCVPSFTNDHDTFARHLDPVLNLEQFDLQFLFVLLVGCAPYPGLVGICAASEKILDLLRVVAHLTEKTCGRGLLRLCPGHVLCGVFFLYRNNGFRLPCFVVRHGA